MFAVTVYTLFLSEVLIATNLVNMKNLFFFFWKIFDEYVMCPILEQSIPSLILQSVECRIIFTIQGNERLRQNILTSEVNLSACQVTVKSFLSFSAAPCQEQLQGCLKMLDHSCTFFFFALWRTLTQIKQKQKRYSLHKLVNNCHCNRGSDRSYLNSCHRLRILEGWKLCFALER